MGQLDLIALRSHPTARRIVASWRALTRNPQSARTVVACSGGADSTALALALASAKLDISLAHVRHDIRSPADTLGDRDAAHDLARRLALSFDERQISITPGNAEAQARRLRYGALAEIARAQDAAFVATAHHADDQLETMIMGLIRGAGPQGLRGVAPRRALGDDLWLIRPMLRVTHEQAMELCREGGVTWREDTTNLDTTRFRAALRHGPLAGLRELRPAGALHASRSAELLGEASALIDERAGEVFGVESTWPREVLRHEPAVILGTGLRAAALRLTGGAHADALTGRVVDPAVRAITDDSTQPRSFDWPGDLQLNVTARDVSLRLVSDG